MAGLLSRFRREPEVAEPEPPRWSEDNLPPMIDDARIYVAHGDRTWGNSITCDAVGDHTLSVAGWLARAPFPRTGDKLLTKMTSGKWGVFVFGDVRICGDPSDMFTATAYGAVGYAEDEPQTTRCDELIPDLSPYLR